MFFLTFVNGEIDVGRQEGAAGAPTSPEHLQSGHRDLSRPQLLLAGIALSGMWAVVLASVLNVFAPGPWFTRALIIAFSSTMAACLIRVIWPDLRVRACLGGGMVGGGAWIWWVTHSERLLQWGNDRAALVTQIHADLVTGVAPVMVSGPLEDLLLLLTVLTSFLSLLVLVGLSAPLVASVLPALALLIPVAVTGMPLPDGTLIWAGVFLALAAWSGSPRLRWGGVILVAAAVGIAAVVLVLLPPTRDRIWNEGVVAAPAGGSVPDVTVALAEDLRERSETVVFTFSSSAPGSQRFTLATLSDFNGGRWEPDDALTPEGWAVTVPRSSLTTPPQVLEEATNLDGISDQGASVTITIEALTSTWLPLPQSAVVVEKTEEASSFDPARWLWTVDAATAQGEGISTRRGDQYRAYATSVLATDSLRVGGSAVDTVTSDLAPFVQLPEPLPPSLTEAAAQVTEGRSDPLGIGFALQDWFRGGDFVYDESAPYRPGMDPDDPFAVMEAFLVERRGFCVHYASTFAVMARSLGVPTRIAVGYAASAQGVSTTTVQGRQLHAWPEIFVEGLGWVAFEPTPGGAGLFADTGEDVPAEPDQLLPPEEEQPEEASPLEDSPPESNEEESAHTTEDTEVATPDLESEAESGGWNWRATGSALFLLVCAFLPAIVRILRRERRMRAVKKGITPATHAWEEFVDTVGDLGFLPHQGRGASMRQKAAIRRNAGPATPGSGSGTNDLPLLGRTRNLSALSHTSLGTQILPPGTPEVVLSSQSGDTSPLPRAHTPEAFLDNLEERGILLDEAQAAARRLAEARGAEVYGGETYDSKRGVQTETSGSSTALFGTSGTSAPFPSKGSAVNGTTASASNEDNNRRASIPSDNEFVALLGIAQKGVRSQASTGAKVRAFLLPRSLTRR